MSWHASNACCSPKPVTWEAMQLKVKIENQFKPHNRIFQLWRASCCTWAEWEEGKGNCDKKKKKVPQVGILEEASAPRQEYLGDTWPGGGRGSGILEHSRRETCLNLEYQTMCNHNFLRIFKITKDSYTSCKQYYIISSDSPPCILPIVKWEYLRRVLGESEIGTGQDEDEDVDRWWNRISAVVSCQSRAGCEIRSAGSDWIMEKLCFPSFTIKVILRHHFDLQGRAGEIKTGG